MRFSRRLHPITSVWLKEFREEFPDMEIFYRIEGEESHGTPSDDAGYTQITIDQPARKGRG